MTSREQFRADYRMARAVIRLSDAMLLAGARAPGNALSLWDALPYGPAVCAALKFGDPLQFPPRRQHGRWVGRIRRDAKR